MRIAPSRENASVYIGAVIIAASLGGFGLIADEVIEGDTLAFDRAILMALREPGDPFDPIGPAWFEEAARDITALGSFSVLAIVVVATAIYLFLRRKTRTAWLLIFAVVGGTVLSTALKSVFDRPRPDLMSSVRVFTASFPSGHATVSAVVYLTIGVLLANAAAEWRFRVFYLGLAIFLTLLVGVSRIYLGVHYPTDVIAGWSLGTAWAILCWTVARLVLPDPAPAAAAVR